MGLKLRLFFFLLNLSPRKWLKENTKRLVVATALAAGIEAIAVPGVDVVIDTVFFVHEVRHYMRVSGVEQERVNTFKDVDHSLLKCRSLSEPNFITKRFVGIQIGTYATLAPEL